MKSLFIDGDESIRALLSRMFSNYAHTVEVMTEEKTGLGLVTAYTYDLLISNVSLPQLDGISLCQQRRVEGDHTPLLVLTESDISINSTQSLDAGADDHVAKPFDLVSSWHGYTPCYAVGFDSGSFRNQVGQVMPEPGSNLSKPLAIAHA